MPLRCARSVRTSFHTCTLCSPNYASTVYDASEERCMKGLSHTMCHAEFALLLWNLSHNRYSFVEEHTSSLP